MSIPRKESEALGLVNEINEEMETLKDLVIWHIDDIEAMRRIITETIPGYLTQILDIISPQSPYTNHDKIPNREAKSIISIINEVTMKLVDGSTLNDESNCMRIKQALTRMIDVYLPWIRNPIDSVTYDPENVGRIIIKLEPRFQKLMEEALSGNEN